MTFGPGAASASRSWAVSRAMHRVDSLAIAQLADGRAGRRLDVGVGIAPRPAEPSGELAPDRGLAGAHQPGDDDVLDSAHRHRVAAYTRPMARPLTARAAGRHRHPGRRPARADARPGGARDGLSDRGPRPRSRLPGGRRRRSAVVVGAYDDVGAALRLAELSDVVTYELEHVAAAVIEAVEARGPPSRPGPRAVARDPGSARRATVRRGGRASPSRRGARSGRSADARSAAETLGLPLRLKLPTGGYDGRGPAPDRGGRRARRRLGAPRPAAGVAAARRARARLRGGAVGRRRSRRSTARSRPSRSPGTSTMPGSSSKSVAPAPGLGRGRRSAPPRSGRRWRRRWTCAAR